MNLLKDKQPRNSLVGLVFGRLTVVSVDGYTIPPCGRYEWFYLCKCECGNTKSISSQNLRKGDSKSCGCLQKEHGKSVNYLHGLSFSSTYYTWASMHQRCRNKNHVGYVNYGARGIKVCDRWNTFENFLEDMGHRPEGKTIDRINNDDGYNKLNCRWASRSEQAKNKRKRFKPSTITVNETGKFPEIIKFDFSQTEEIAA